MRLTVHYSFRPPQTISKHKIYVFNQVFYVTVRATVCFEREIRAAGQR